MYCVERNVSTIERCVLFALALAVSGGLFSLALAEQFFWQGCICLFAAIIACEMLYVDAFWPKVEQVVGQNRSKMSFNVSSNQRNIALKQAFATSGCQTIIMLIIWMLLCSHIIGGILLLACVITNFLLWRRFHLHLYDTNRGGVQGNSEKDDLTESENVKGQLSKGNRRNNFAGLIRHRLAIVLILISVIMARIIIMCIMYGSPSFCTRCIMYWGEHRSSYSGDYAEHSLLSIGIFGD